MIYFYILIISVIGICLQSRYIGKKLNLLDHPAKNKIHKIPVALIGGLVLFFSMGSYFIFNIYINDDVLIYLYSSLFFFVGLIDDKKNINPKLRILLILIISLIFINLSEKFIIEKIYFENFGKEFYFGINKIPVTLFCILLFYIAMNMMDGINCLVVLFVIFSLVIFKLLIVGVSLSYLDFVLIISLSILFFFNYRNHLFLGNSGTTLLSGYLIFTLILNNYENKVNVWLIISLLLIPGVDMVRLFFTRISLSKNPLVRDTLHFHHILLKKFNLQFSLIIYCLLSFMPVFSEYFFHMNIFLIQALCLVIYFSIILKSNNK